MPTERSRSSGVGGEPLGKKTGVGHRPDSVGDQILDGEVHFQTLFEDLVSLGESELSLLPTEEIEDDRAGESVHRLPELPGTQDPQLDEKTADPLPLLPTLPHRRELFVGDSTFPLQEAGEAPLLTA